MALVDHSRHPPEEGAEVPSPGKGWGHSLGPPEAASSPPGVPPRGGLHPGVGSASEWGSAGMGWAAVEGTGWGGGRAAGIAPAVQGEGTALAASAAADSRGSA